MTGRTDGGAFNVTLELNVNLVVTIVPLDACAFEYVCWVTSRRCKRKKGDS